MLGLAITAATLPANASAQSRPFNVGEELTYRVKFGKIPVGTARMHVAGVEDVRGHPTFHLVFTIDGGLPLFRVHDRYDSWIDTLTLASRRHVQEIREGGYKRNRRYEIFPEERAYRENDDTTLKASVDSPLDEGSFIYFIRTVRVPVGQTREFQQYFKPDRNPVVIRALRRDTVEVPSGRYPTVVVRPLHRCVGRARRRRWKQCDACRLDLRAHCSGTSASLHFTMCDRLRRTQRFGHVGSEQVMRCGERRSG
jgi:hypothetical protein